MAFLPSLRAVVAVLLRICVCAQVKIRKELEQLAQELKADNDVLDAKGKGTGGGDETEGVDRIVFTLAPNSLQRIR